jgi:hypothetical protein
MSERPRDSLRQRLRAASEVGDAGDWSEVERLALLAPPSAREGRIGGASLGRRHRTLAVGLGLALALAAPTFALGYFVFASSTPVIVAPVGVPVLPRGWTAFSSVPYLLRPGGTQAQTTITSWGYRPSPGPGPAAELPPGGIMISVTLLRSQDFGARKVDLCATAPRIAGYPDRKLPLALPRSTTNTLEGAPRVNEFRVFGRYRNFYNFEIRADIDTQRSLAPRWSAAESVVSRLRFPAWPVKRTC